MNLPRRTPATVLPPAPVMSREVEQEIAYYGHGSSSATVNHELRVRAWVEQVAKLKEQELISLRQERDTLRKLLGES